MPVEAAASAAPGAVGGDAEAEDAAVDVPPSEPPQAAARVRVPRARGTAARSRPRWWWVLRSQTCPVVSLSCVCMVPPPVPWWHQDTREEHPPASRIDPSPEPAGPLRSTGVPRGPGGPGSRRRPALARRGAGQCSGELPPGGDVEFPEHLVHVVLDGGD